MKKYATITSERASKGQGGEYVDVELKNENKETEYIIQYRHNKTYNRSSINVLTGSGVSLFYEIKNKSIKERLEYLRKELRAERISYEELAELQSLADHIDADDVELLEAAGVVENEQEDCEAVFCKAPAKYIIRHSETKEDLYSCEFHRKAGKLIEKLDKDQDMSKKGKQQKGECENHIGWCAKCQKRHY